MKLPLWVEVYERLKEIDYDAYQDLAKSGECDEIKSMFTKEELAVLLTKMLLDND